MAPLSQFGLAALAVISVAAAPLPTQPNSATILQPRGFLTELLEEINLFGKHMDGKTKVKTKSMLENALEVEKQLKGEHDKREMDPDDVSTWPICEELFWPAPYFRKCRLNVGEVHRVGN